MFPSMKAARLLAILLREPLTYRIKRQRGSHRRLVSEAGYHPLSFAYHAGATVSPGDVRDILVNQAGVPEDMALGLVTGRRRQVR
jgi:predicted RNA binding protein YcfA (HicA-like mRNA interferase family)